MIRIAMFLFLSAFPAQADILVRFDEGAPKDRFTFTNVGACPLPAARLSLDLSPAPSGLIFDVTGSGAGLNVFQPFEVVEGADALTAQPQVLDGDSRISLTVRSLGAGESIAFTIDVDETTGQTGTIVSGSEIAGARAGIALGGSLTDAAFGPNAEARIPLAACLS